MKYENRIAEKSVWAYAQTLFFMKKMHVKQFLVGHFPNVNQKFS